MAATLAPRHDAFETPTMAVDPPGPATSATPATPATAPAPRPHVDAVPAGAPAIPLPAVNPITVSMTLAVLFLLVVLASVSLRPSTVDDTRGADEAPVVIEEAHAGR